MARLPQPGADAGNWGTILNDYLSQAHTTDGALKSGIISTALIQDGAVTEAKLDTATQVKLNSAGPGVTSVNSLTGTVTLTTDTISDTGSTNKYATAAQLTKIDGVQTGATANATDANLRDRTTHTGAQAISTVTGLQAALDAKAAITHSHAIADVTNLQTSLNAKADSSTVTTGLAGKADTTTQIATSGSLTGGGDLSATRTLSLSGDSATPGNSRYYGTNDSGTKGFFALPTPSGQTLVLNVKEYGAVGDKTTDDTAAFTAALAAAKSSTLTGATAAVWVPGGNYTVGPLVLGNRVTIRGAGPGTSRLFLRAGSTAPLIGIETHARACGVFDLTLDGNRGAVSSTNALGLFFDNSAAQDSDTGNGLAEYVDSRHFAHNLIIQNCAGTGFKQLGRGTTIGSNIQSWYNAGHGFDVDVDSSYTNCDSGAAGLDGFIIRSGSNRFSNCKAWYSGQVSTTGSETDGTGHGFHLMNGLYSANTFASCGAQDNARAGFYLKNTGRQTLTGIESDSNNTANLNHAGVELIDSYGNRVSGYSWERNANTVKQLAGLRILGGYGHAVDVTCDGLQYMPQGYFTTDSYPFGCDVKIGAKDGLVTNSYVASWTPDVYSGHYQLMALTGNVTVNAPARAHFGQTVTLGFSQDATGGRTVTFASEYHTSWTPVTTANKLNSITFLYNGSIWIQTAAAVGM
ncbi:hypothetical protein A2707_04555 [Candidatus Saccharibacteria bacterium RIFCSPHIGHO2_01_FULL_45_15]|nr:MAG: hypothetical protein A2707_04555 [Candidatus Saccharibacteria bacterium RIFCSPHIGHO2_01_FULL_45_15]OGL32754.1 MAG: hypothetical protein A3E76_05405 [Candidatus Saccharibacteria bacterium RIFCSPHIGHO2_12_FULL_44_22]